MTKVGSIEAPSPHSPSVISPAAATTATSSGPCSRSDCGPTDSSGSILDSPRLLVLTPDFPPARGGIQVLSHRIASGLDAFNIKVVTTDAPEADAFDARDRLDVRRVRAESRLGPGRNIPLNAVALAEGLRFRPHAVLSVHIVTSPAASSISRLLGIPTAQYFHAKEIGAKPRLAAFAASHATVVIAVSAYTAGLVAERGATPRPTHLIPPGVDLPLDTDPIPVERPTMLTVARLEDRYKGHDQMLRALPLIRAAVPEVRWVVIGDGPLRSGLERLAEAQGVADAVEFLGAVDDGERNLWLRRTDLFAMPSRLPAGNFAGEGFGIVYLEAGAFGKPVLAGNVGGPLDAVRDGETGLLVDPTDHVALADAAIRLLRDRELARKLGAAGIVNARAHAWPEICARVQGVLLEQLHVSRP